jgi:hypothetical protein
MAALVQVCQSAHVEEPKALGSLESAYEPARVDRFGKVEERAGNGGHRDFIQRMAVFRLQLPYVMQDDFGSAAAPTTRRGHVDAGSGKGNQIPECSRAPMTQHGFWSAGKYGGQPATAESESRMPNRVHAAMNRVKASALYAMVNRADPEAERLQLRTSDDSMLSFRNASDLPLLPELTWSTLTSYITVDVDHVGDGANDGSTTRAECRASVTKPRGP